MNKADKMLDCILPSGMLICPNFKYVNTVRESY